MSQVTGSTQSEGLEKQAAPKRRWDPWPVSIIAFFSVAIAGLATFIVFCNRHPADLVAENYYEQELRYQGQMERNQRARESAAAAKVNYDSAAGVITVALPGRGASAPVAGTITLYRPSSVKLDRELKLEPDASGLQKVDARSLEPGLWAVRVSWTAEQQEYYVEEKIVVRGRGA